MTGEELSSMPSEGSCSREAPASSELAASIEVRATQQQCLCHLVKGCAMQPGRRCEWDPLCHGDHPFRQTIFRMKVIGVAANITPAAGSVGTCLDSRFHRKWAGAASHALAGMGIDFSCAWSSLCAAQADEWHDAVARQQTVMQRLAGAEDGHAPSTDFDDSSSQVQPSCSRLLWFL